MRVYIRAPVSPTEEREKVIKAVLNIFPDAEIREEEGYITAITASLEYFKELMKKERIRDTMRDALIHSASENVLEFTLNKQAAYMGRVSLGALSPLGDIDVKVECQDVESLIHYLTEVEL